MVENKDKTVCSWMKTPYKSTAFTILDLSGEARKKTLWLGWMMFAGYIREGTRARY